MSEPLPSVWHVLPDNYVSAVGHVIVQWAYFEVEFNEWMTSFMFMNGPAKQLGMLINGKREIPHPWNKRHALFKNAAKICFSDCPSLVRKLHKIADQANSLHDFRDRVAHGKWALGGGYRRKPQTVSSSLVKRGKIDHLKDLPLDKLESAAQRAGELTAKLMKIMYAGQGWWPGWFDLTSSEIKIVQDFRMNNLPKLPEPRYMPFPPRSLRA